MNRMQRKFMPWLLSSVCLFQAMISIAQCPVNIGFEAGNFNYWQCGIGNISRTGEITVIPSTPSPGRHTLNDVSTPQVMDPYGDFPINCPNGSGYSIRLGNKETKNQAEQVSYTFNIPDNDNNYSIIYNYAVVFQNPNHEEFEQPKFTANVFDVSNDKYIGCSSFSYTASANLPGFKLSTLSDSNVYYKPWTPVTIKLSGYAGRTIRLEFTTNDCTRGGHFGYAYLDVNENCSSPISGNTACGSSSSQLLTAPFGFSGYRWFNADFSKIVGKEITLPLFPIPQQGTVFAVEITPYPDQGCIDTVYTTIAYSSEELELKLPNTVIKSCVSTPFDLTSKFITTGSTPGLRLSYFTDPGLNYYIPAPKQIIKSGTYYIKAENKEGCTTMKPITIQVDGLPDFTVTDPAPVTRPATINLLEAIKGSTGGLVISYWEDRLTTRPLSNPHSINLNGTYYIKATTIGGCAVINAVTVVINEAIISPPNAFSPNKDGIHDEWEIPLLSLYPECTVAIYNRLGQLLIKTVGYPKPWDGKINGIDQPVATYYYVIKPGPNLPPIGGTVTIIR
ncbi:MAG: gliding motility-associated C-terminal domain-containing protein [Sediminibacterium sp.]|nr:gliding motility-associated C-terminal domain-containing protein [Sediminibacterium sp.]MDP1812400.1 gliding motility-associated C-terminal domain-containing protein [Sediminibacterium sp.]MDP3129192.1 gliding motility-associated C-terminal domain-containing protein [Sediminibacterium sp.]